MVKMVLSTHEVAKICNAHQTTVINWIKEGKLKGYSTPGGHRRIKKEDLLDFMKKYQFPIPLYLAKKKKIVLIVDDDPSAIEEFKEVLGGNGVQLDFASDGFEAGRKIYMRKPDLIFLDFRMPGMNGFEVCKFLRQDKETTHIPIVAVTVLNSEEDKKRILDCGVQEYIAKPADPEKLIAVIKELLK